MRIEMIRYSAAGVLCFCAFFGSLNGSAIPMWEFLSKDEKTSFIYSMFANQVEKFCENSNIPNCNWRLLKYGLGTLKNLPEEQLDAMDPYQRDANNIIWEALMQGNRYQKTTPKPPSTSHHRSSSSSTAKPNSYEDPSFSDYDEYGAHGAASARIDNTYILPPPKGFIPKSNNDDITTGQKSSLSTNSNTDTIIIMTLRKQQQQQQQPSNTFNRFQNQYKPTTTEKVTTSTTSNINRRTNDGLLSGPMVVRVYPDGTPVRESTQMPQDDDLRQYQLSHVKIPNL